MRYKDACLLLIFVLFTVLHFFAISSQEFIGDEAAPMLLIDRMWDAITLHDLRFLAYPFLFYNDPFRSIFAGTLLHIFGPDRVILRLPSIFLVFLLFGYSFGFLKKKK